MTEELFEQSIELILQKNSDGLKAIYEAYGSYIFALMKGMTGSREDAQDLTTEFFIKIWEKAESYRPGRGHRSWMSVIARNMAIDFMKKNRKITPAEEVCRDSQAADMLTPEEKTVGEMSFADTVSLLKDPDKMIVTMKIVGQMTFQEISDILRIPLGTVTWKYRNSIEKLRRAGI